MEYRWENNFSLKGRLREVGAGVRDDSIRNVFGPRVRLVKSFAGIMNPTRLVILTSFFLRGKQGLNVAR